MSAFFVCEEAQHHKRLAQVMCGHAPVISGWQLAIPPLK